ncbi:hypothetical protein CHS0354_010006 [Potamilus streckersoni]|uniref:Uncharacterized protein n=1 Tax=Potamilus streckersoni TaxID=2493646 RepID=A0AAE0SCG0_9BIVA|nr:hypothetical protein CHS0354_010006 [Potamilus streckersoni]
MFAVTTIRSQMTTFWGFPTVFTGTRIITLSEENAKISQPTSTFLNSNQVMNQGYLPRDCQNQLIQQTTPLPKFYAEEAKKDQVPSEEKSGKIEEAIIHSHRIVKRGAPGTICIMQKNSKMLARLDWQREKKRKLEQRR